MSEKISFTVKKIYPPNGRGPAGVMVDHQYGKVQVWPDDLGNFQEGGQYEVFVDCKEYNSKNQYTVNGKAGITKLGGFEQNSQSNTSQASQAGWGYEEGIFITGIVGRSMGSGKFGSEDIHGLVVAAKEAFKANQS